MLPAVGKGRGQWYLSESQGPHSILYLPPKEVSLPGFVIAAGSGSHRVRDRITAEKDTKESMKLKGQKNIVRMEA